MINVNDPDAVEALSFEDFEKSMFDLRGHHTPVLNGKIYFPRSRPWDQVRGVTLHQTACWMGEKPERYWHIGAHFAVTREGRIFRMADLDRLVIHGNGWNNQCVGIEVDGLYAGLEDDPNTIPNEALLTTWNDPTTKVRETPMKVTAESMTRLRQLLRWIYFEIARNGGAQKVLGAHRQSSGNRENDPGQAIWQSSAVPIQAELRLSDGGPGFFLTNPPEHGGNGKPIPTAWNPDYHGFKY